ncbi:MAG: glutamate-5-semialdehyde dehydrogenase [Eggerthellaceae bacterium]|nr:glutamate-5-semialdehyde dehydrogenase [Eggerthellaceae bacterium]
MNVQEILQAAKQASVACGTASLEVRNDALSEMAYALRTEVDSILAANQTDMDAAREAGTKESLLDRLMLDEARIYDIADALEALRDLDDPLGVVSVDRILDSGVHMQRISVPMGVVAMVYEARPNVTADAAGICIKTGNACVLRGGSMAHNSNLAMARILHDAAVATGMPENCILAVETTDRSATDELLRARGLVDLLIPRGGAGLIAHCVENATVPVIETGVGNCHVYIHDPADLDMARNIVLNAKCQRPGVCNAIESILVDASIAEDALASLLPALHEAGVILHTDALASTAAAKAGIPAVMAVEDDWAREYLDLEVAIKCVQGLDEAIAHVNRFGTKHSECIVTEDEAAAMRFLAEVDAAAVYWNASTRFTDGGEFGLGAEIGISTQKLHARGPFALEALCSYKYVVCGTGQVRG